MITGIDHIAVTVRDFDRTVANYETILGRAPRWHGFMPGSQHAWFQLPGVALDIISPHGTGVEADAINEQLDKFGEGIWGLGFAVADLEAATRLFERRGLTLVPRYSAQTKDASGDERIWETAMLKRKSTNGVSLFLVESGESFPVDPIMFGDASVGTLDHIVIASENPERAIALYGARLGLDLRLDRVNEQWGARQLFFRTGDAVVEIGANLKAPVSDTPDKFGGLAWRVKDPAAARARIAAAGIDVSDLRKGRKPGTEVFTVREGTGGVPTLMIS